MNPALIAIISRFAPQIREKAMPAIHEMLDQAVGDVELMEGEDSACVIVSRYHGEWWTYVATLTPTNIVLRTIKSCKLEDLVTKALQNLEKL